jgi:3-phosphoshikimate 1-carboxyvinyltransferase
MTQRAIAAALLAYGESAIVNPSLCFDALVARGIAAALGSIVMEHNKTLRIAAHSRHCADTLHCGESAFCVRLFTPIAALLGMSLTVIGNGTLLSRPLPDVTDALAAFGVTASMENNLLPIHLSGVLQSGTATVDGSKSSQTLSGLLMALPVLRGNSEITVTRLASRPYVDMTLEVMRAFGVTVTHDDYRHFHIRGNQRYMPQTYTVEGDWSGAAFWLATAAIGGDITVTGLRNNSAQADKAILQALQQAGAIVQWQGDTLTVRRNTLKAFRFNASDCPDLFPPLTLLAAFCEGVSVIEGAERLIHKESNRAAALQQTFGKLGIAVSTEGDKLIVQGGTVRGGDVSSFHDHRIAMAAACAGLFTDTPVRIDDTECINKSYPQFMQINYKL